MKKLKSRFPIILIHQNFGLAFINLLRTTFIFHKRWKRMVILFTVLRADNFWLPLLPISEVDLQEK